VTSAEEEPVPPMLDIDDARRLQECLAAGGVAVFPADTVYGLACDPLQQLAVQRLYELKGRPPERPAAVMFFALERALEALPELGSAERAALGALLPGPLTLVLPNPRARFPLAAGPAPDGPAPDGPPSLGLRVPLLPPHLAALRAVKGPVMQSSANLSGGPEAQRLADIPSALLQRADLVIDGGELPGTASTVLDLREYERGSQWSILREGAVERAELERVLA
jgi:L-threonylcarbamoyladenylate synthase